MKIRIIALNKVTPLRSQAIYQGLANSISENSEPILVLLRPSSPYISVGLHQDIEKEINTDWCKDQQIPIIRRSVGGGTVLLDEQQLFFQFIFPKKMAPMRPADMYKRFLTPVIHCYESWGCQDVTLQDNDIHIRGKKICGAGAASIANASVVVGSFLFKFDYATMANCINSPSREFIETFCHLMQEKMTTLCDEVSNPPKDQQLISLLGRHIREDLGLVPTLSSLTEAETGFIKEAETELRDEDFLNLSGNRLVKNGIKLAAKSYLVETRLQDDSSEHVIRLLTYNDNAERIWIHSNNEFYKALENEINQNKPSKQEL